ncbi:hypothetical protein BJX61DRAFT_540468 [Aspergillus egyptiacus]|nr:hypothetical protein BJX61DRAFT_540468 [Aspergillus egyptiacus]
MGSHSTYTLRQAPPVRPSRSLEGLENVVPPASTTRSRLHLDKPLPDLPTTQLPTTSTSLPIMADMTAWSDDSTVDSFEVHDQDRRRSSSSTESYPVFVRSGSDDLADFVDHYSVPTDPCEPGTSSLGPTHDGTFLAEDRYTPPPHWTPANSHGPNHYFREKKWDFFPELATPSGLAQNPSTNLRKKPSVKRRWMPTDKGAALANDVRDSIRSYVQKRLSRSSLDKESKRNDCNGRSTPAPADDSPAYNYYYCSSPPSERTAPSTSGRSDGGPTVPPCYLGDEPDYAGVGEKLVDLSITPTDSTVSDTAPSSVRSPISFPQREKKQKQLAVPITPYQKYGAAIWDKHGKVKRVSSYGQNQRVRFPKYRKPATAKNGFVASPTPPLSPPSRTQLQQSTRYCVRALQDGTSQVLVAINGARRSIDGARKRISSSKDKKQSDIKAQIRLIGPVNPYTSYKPDPWV